MYSICKHIFLRGNKKGKNSLEPRYTRGGFGFEAAEQHVSFMAFTMNPQKRTHVACDSAVACIEHVQNMCTCNIPVTNVIVHGTPTEHAQTMCVSFIVIAIYVQNMYTCNMPNM